jgi:hypothetical protein
MHACCSKNVCLLQLQLGHVLGIGRIARPFYQLRPPHDEREISACGQCNRCETSLRPIHGDTGSHKKNFVKAQACVGHMPSSRHAVQEANTVTCYMQARRVQLYITCYRNRAWQQLTTKLSECCKGMPAWQQLTTKLSECCKGCSCWHCQVDDLPVCCHAGRRLWLRCCSW